MTRAIGEHSNRWANVRSRGIITTAGTCIIYKNEAGPQWITSLLLNIVTVSLNSNIPPSNESMYPCLVKLYLSKTRKKRKRKTLHSHKSVLVYSYLVTDYTTKLLKNFYSNLKRNGYSFEKYNWLHEFKFWMMLSVFRFMLMPLGRPWIDLFFYRLYKKQSGRFGSLWSVWLPL